MRERESERERAIPFCVYEFEMQCQRRYRQLKVFKVNEFVTNESYFSDKQNTFQNVDFKKLLQCAL